MYFALRDEPKSGHNKTVPLSLRETTKQKSEPGNSILLCVNRDVFTKSDSAQQANDNLTKGSDCSEHIVGQLTAS